MRSAFTQCETTSQMNEIEKTAEQVGDVGGKVVTGPRRRWCSPQTVLLITFASFYFAISPGNYFGVDEVMQEETAQALILRRTLDIPAVENGDTRQGRGHSYYTIKGAGLPFVSLPFVYLGLKLDDVFGSMNGGVIAGSPIGRPIGVPEQPLRWTGRLVASTSLIANALAGGAIVAVLFMVGMQLSPNRRAAMLMAIAAGLATLVMSEATHFYQHVLDALMVILGFWFFSGNEGGKLESRVAFGGLSLGIAMLARPDAAPAAVVIWLYGMAVAWNLVRNFPDRRPRMIRTMLLAAAGPLGAVAGSMYFNYLRFGSFIRFGVVGQRERDRFVISVAQIARAIAGYLISPGLSIFLFAPPLILAVLAGRQAYRRWPLQTATLVVAATVHLLFLSLYTSWHGDLSYGPRLMLESIVLLMPLTLPTFEMAVDRASLRAAIAVGAVVFIGFVVQLTGVSVYVTANEWRRVAAGISSGGAWVFVPSASPIVVDLKELIAGRNFGPWAVRALAHPGAALALWNCLILVVLAGGQWLIGYFRAPEESGAISTKLPAGTALTALLLILLGFALARPISDDAPGVRAYVFLQAGLAEQQAGHAVSAAEDYAMVLSVDPSNKYARYDLGILQQEAGYTTEASALYAGALYADPNFTAARQRIASLQRGPVQGEWYLIAPPKTEMGGTEVWDLNAPLSKWVVTRSFASGEDCRLWKINADYQANRVRRTFDVDRCIAADARSARD
jgi:hypothetical protein